MNGLRPAQLAILLGETVARIYELIESGDLVNEAGPGDPVSVSVASAQAYVVRPSKFNRAE